MAGEKKENGAAAEKKKGDEGKQIKEENKKNKNNGNVVVLKIDMHCEGCASKIMKYAKSVQGVEKAKVEWEASKLTVEGKVDPSKLREKLQEKTKKKVELVSPQILPNKDKENKADNDNTNNDKGKNNNNTAKNNNKPQPEDKKPKEPPVTTAVLKLGLHCHGCVEKIHKLVSKTTGVQSVTVEMQKDLVTVTGTMDVAVLAESLKTKMKRVVEVVPQKKKEKDNKEGNNNNKADKDKGKDQKDKEKENDAEEGNDKEEGGEGGGGGNAGGGNAGGGKKKKKGGGSGVGGGGGGEGKEVKDENGGSSNDGGGRLMEGNRMEYFGPPGFAHTGFYGYANPLPPLPPPAIGFGYGYGAANDGALTYYGNATPCPGYNSYGSGYGPVYADPYHAPQMFSDENPNACSVM